MKAIVFLVALCVAAPAFADGLDVGTEVGKVWDFANGRWALATSPSATATLRGFSLTFAPYFDQAGLMETDITFGYSREAKGWTLGGQFARYSFRGLIAKDYVWSVSARREVWKWR